MDPTRPLRLSAEQSKLVKILRYSKSQEELSRCFTKENGEVENQTLFLCQCLNVLDRRLSEPPSLPPPEYIEYLFAKFKDCLDSLELLSPGDSLRICNHHSSRLRSLLSWGLSDGVKEDAYSILKKLRAIPFKGKKYVSGQFLPAIELCGSDADSIPPDVVVKMFRNVARALLRQPGLDNKELENAVILLKEAKPWIWKLNDSDMRLSMKIAGLLLRKVNSEDDKSLEIAQTLVKMKSSQNNCIQCTDQSLNSHRLAMAYSLQVLRNQEVDPKSKVVIQDVRTALENWLTISDGHREGCSFMDYAMFMLCNIADLLAIKGSRELNGEIYRLMIKFSKSRNEKWLSSLWESRRLSHALCISPIDDDFLKEICRLDKSSYTIDYWMKHLHRRADFELKLSYSSGEYGFQIDDAVDAVKKLISDDTQKFTDATLYYDLCEALIPTGRLLEAISYAKKAYKVRLKLLLENYNLPMPNCSNGTIHMRQQIAFRLWVTDATPKEIKQPSPYKVLQCYLESTLQLGRLFEIIGDAAEAESFLLAGQRISNYFGFPVFKVAFSTLSGKIYGVKGPFDKSKMQFQIAEGILSADENIPICLKCRLMMQVSINHHLGNFSPSSKQGDSSALGKLEELDAAINKIKEGDNDPSDTKGEKRKKSEEKCDCKEVICSKCFFVESTKSGLVSAYLEMRWQFVYRRLRIGLPHEQDVEKLHTLFYGDRNSRKTLDGTTIKSLIMKTEFYRNTFALQIVQVLYDQCFTTLSKNGTRPCLFELADVVQLLLEAFVLCREEPELLKKVSTLLAIIYIISTTLKEYRITLPRCDEDLSESHWASYFHQASLGTNLNHQFFLNKSRGEQGISTESTIRETDYLMRVAPKSAKTLETFVNGFFSSLPKTTIFCISLITGSSASMLQNLLELDCDGDLQGWVIVSRLHSKDEPVVTLRPLYSRFEGTSNDVGGEEIEFAILPRFRQILMKQDTYIVDLKQPTSDYKKKMNILNKELEELLRDLEREWFDSFKPVLLGGCLSSDTIKQLQSNVMKNLESECSLKVNKLLLNAILCAPEDENSVNLLLSLHKGCVVDKGDRKLAATERGVFLMSEAMKSVTKLKKQKTVNTEPAILVLDHELQMLPWESIPTLRSQEVYRLPTIGCISWIFQKANNRHESSPPPPFPSIDPLDAYLVLNPSGDLKYAQAGFEKWLNEHTIEKIVGYAPTNKQWKNAVENHDVFIYVGHDDGTQFFPREDIIALKKSGAILLMGCNSGLLELQGRYIPTGAPLDYLLAGSPVVLSNLWVVSNENDKYPKAILTNWRDRQSEGHTVGSFMAAGRRAVDFSYVMGATVVWYGVPARLRRE